MKFDRKKVLKRVIDNIRRQRTLVGMDHKSLARAINRTPSTISHWETHTTIPKLDDFLHVCNVLNVKPEKILHGNTHNDTNGLTWEQRKTIAALVQELRRLNEETKKCTS